jgi:hypothetical protein
MRREWTLTWPVNLEKPLVNVFPCDDDDEG